MTEREVRDAVLKYFYDFNKRTGKQIATRCGNLANSVLHIDAGQVVRVCEQLYKDGYIDFTTAGFNSNDGLIRSMTSKGYSYVEENLLSETESVLYGLKDTDTMVKSGAEISIDAGGDESTGDFSSAFSSDFHIGKPAKYVAKPYKGKYVDSTISPCFGVDALAAKYLELIDAISDQKSRNISMLGIFGTWGRGKTYFFNTIKKRIEDDKNYNSKYRVCEFNAWKYQSAPGIWANLFESIHNIADGWSKVGYWLRRNWSLVALGLAFLSIIVLFVLISAGVCVGIWRPITWIVSAVVFAIFICHNIYKNFGYIIPFIQRQINKVSFKECLGIQDSIEKEIENFLCFYIPDKQISEKKVLLYVEDIDRCNEIQMISVIESLRTIMENERIKSRLIIVCSIDQEKLKKALEIKYKPLYEDENELYATVRRQIDKIFLSGIALPPLSQKDCDEYLDILDAVANKTTIIKDKVNTSVIGDVDNPPADSQRESTNSDNDLAKNQLIQFIKQAVSNVQYKDMTPRLLRIIYYRCLLAMNIMSLKSESFTEDLVSSIVSRSIGNNESGDSEYNTVLSVVVPY